MRDLRHRRRRSRVPKALVDCSHRAPSLQNFTPSKDARNRRLQTMRHVNRRDHFQSAIEAASTMIAMIIKRSTGPETRC